MVAPTGALYLTVVSFNGNPNEGLFILPMFDFYVEVTPTLSTNLKIKEFPDGSFQFLHTDTSYLRAHRQKSVFEGLEVAAGEVRNAHRAVQKVYDLARSNHWDYFLTMTIAESYADRYDYDSCAGIAKKYTDVLRHRDCKWLMVPEQHKDGAYHFHALVQGQLPLAEARSPYTGKLLQDKSGRQIYNVDNYRYGWTTVTQVGDEHKASSYLTKYLSKKIDVPKGRKRYWASKSLDRPVVYYASCSREMYERYILRDARYCKVISTQEFGDFVLCED